jgi:hypothetical protein
MQRGQRLGFEIHWAADAGTAEPVENRADGAGEFGVESCVGR